MRVSILTIDIIPVVTISSLVNTAVTISWTRPDLLAVTYTVSMTRVTGRGQVLCPDNADEKPAVETRESTTSFTGLEEFSVYMVTVSAAFGDTTKTANKTFTSQSAGMNTEFVIVCSYYNYDVLSSLRDSTKCDCHHNLQKHHGDLGHYRVH